MNGWLLLVLLVAAIALMIVSISRWKVHPFLAITGVSLLLAICAGLPLSSIPQTIGKGFSSIFTSIGLVIIFGTLIGLVLERTGAAVRLADSVLRVVGPRHPQLALMLVGWVVSIPVFCDSGFVIVNPVRKSLAARSGVSSVSLTLALAAGLYAAHVFIPPTPGPVAAAGMVGLEDNLLLVVGIGAAISFFALVPAYFYARHIGRKVHSAEEAATTSAEDSDAVGDLSKLPSTAASLMPILVPVLLMAMGSIAAVVNLPDGISSLMVFLGKPVIALIAGFLCSLPLLGTTGKMRDLYDITQDTLRTAGPIIFITAAGSILGQVIVEAGFVQFIQGQASSLTAVGVLFPFVIAAILKSAQGSSTVAITTTAGIMGLYSDAGSMMAAMGMTSPLAAALAVMAIGAGAMTVSHANDSYFWVVTNFGGISPSDGYRTQTAMTLIMGLSSIAAIFVASVLFC